MGEGKTHTHNSVTRQITRNMAAAGNEGETLLPDIEEEEEAEEMEREIESEDEERMGVENSEDDEDEDDEGDTSEDERENEAEIQRLEEQVGFSQNEWRDSAANRLL